MQTKSSKLPPIISHTPRDWSSDGVRIKPDACKGCRLYTKGAGFCPDDDPTNAKVAVLLPFPGTDDIVEQVPMSGGIGKYFLQKFVYPFGYRREDVLISHCLRCMQPKFKGRPTYPIAPNRVQAENVCRLHDSIHGNKGALVAGGLLAFNPDMFLVTFDPADLFSVGCYTRLVHRTMEKAWGFAKKGHRPVVLAGLEPLELVAPWLKGGVKIWQGTHFFSPWPFNSQFKPKGFSAA